MLKSLHIFELKYWLQYIFFYIDIKTLNITMIYAINEFLNIRAPL